MAVSTGTVSLGGVSHPARGSRVGLVFWIAICVGGGALIGASTAGGDSAWYQAMAKPAWNPPPAVFAPVWTILYLLMGIAAWRVWRDGGWSAQRFALTLFGAQLVANFLWSILFFNLQSLSGALADIALLWALLLVTTRVFLRVDRTAGWLLLPYLAWVTFAASLNVALVRLN